MTNQHDIDQAVDQVLGSGLILANEDEVLHQLDTELQQQTGSQAMVLGGEEPAPWVLGSESGSRFGSLAQRFIDFHGDALYRKICDPERGQIKDQYRTLVSGEDINGRVKALVPTVLVAIGVGASLISPAIIAALVALWLVKLGLDQWCAMPRTSAASGVAAAEGNPSST